MERNEDLKGVAKIWRESFAFLPGILKLLVQFCAPKGRVGCNPYNSTLRSHRQQKLTLSTDIPNISLRRLLSCTTSLSISHEALLRALTQAAFNSGLCHRGQALRGSGLVQDSEPNPLSYLFASNIWRLDHEHFFALFTCACVPSFLSVFHLLNPPPMTSHLKSNSVRHHQDPPSTFNFRLSIEALHVSSSNGSSPLHSLPHTHPPHRYTHAHTHTQR